MLYASIAIAAPVHHAFTYLVPDGMNAAPGALALVPFRKRKIAGVCLKISHSPPKGAESIEIKHIHEIPDDAPVMSPAIVKLVEWISSYYCAPIGEVCRAALPARLLNLKAPKTTRPAAPIEIEFNTQKKVELNKDQSDALRDVTRAINEKKTGVFLLQGITGSGKTEVYLKLFEEIVRRGGQGLFLVPEIGLVPQAASRACARFGGRVSVYHSGLTDAQRHKEWQKIKDGGIDVVVGTRSALFTPLPKLGLIVVDEEHDASYKQDDGVTYNGRDSAVMRAHIENVPVVLGSATPSLESVQNVKSGKYKRLFLHSRHGDAALPLVEIVDMRNISKKTDGAAGSKGREKQREMLSLSAPLYDAISDTLAKKEQALLYIGRRGFAAAVQCASCGKILTCPNCDISLAMHQRKHNSGTLVCHYCGYCKNVPERCDECFNLPLVPVGHGTERLEAELKDFFPHARIARFDSDSASAPLKRKKILGDMRARKIDILIGTQMVTKGHDFPSITLVGVVSADVALNIPDFRAAERTFQLLTQVAGRAGRGDAPGRVIIQTRQPWHASFQSALTHDSQAFAEKELAHRKDLLYPPYSRLINIRISSRKEDAAKKTAMTVQRTIKKILGKFLDGREMDILGPAEAPIARLKDKWRWQVMLKVPGAHVVEKVISAIRDPLVGRLPAGVRVAIDVDPINLL